MLVQRVNRRSTSAQGTFGELALRERGGLVLFTGELPWRDNARGRSCIPEGDYPCRWRTSSHFGMVYGVFDVPGRSDVLVHNGNFCGDTAAGYFSHVLGCVILGYALGTIHQQKAILNSRPAFRLFNEVMAGQPFILEVRNNGLF